MVRHAGFGDEDVETIMGEAYSLNKILEASDKRAREIKQNKNEAAKPEIQTELLSLQKKKDEAVARTVNRYLLQDLREEGMNKLQSFIKTKVKGNIEKILTRDTLQPNELALNKTLAKSFASRQSSGAQLYLYSSAWDDGVNVYGSGSLSEQYASSTSYRVTTTVTSPSGRSNTTAGDWNYATVSNNTGLSLGDEDGTYTIQADFEEQNGYYDEYGNFYGNGGSFVGTSVNSLQVRPIISISAVNPTTIAFDRTTGTSKSSTASISLSLDVRDFPQPVYITVGLGKQSGTDFYTIDGGRVLRDRIPHSNPGGIVTATYSFTPRQNFLDAGQAVEQFLITSVWKKTGTNPQTGDPTYTELNPMTDFQYGTRSVNINLSIPAQTQASGGSSGEIDRCYHRGFEWNFEGNYCDTSNCIFPDGCSPIVIDTQGDGFALTNATGGVLFDLGATGTASQISWTSANGDDAWLALDRNQNNRIDDGRELFGTASEQPDGTNPRNGFASLAMFDLPAKGGNGDGQITRSDAVFQKLRLWIDRNHNGISEPEELYRLPALDVVAISLDYKESKRTDEFGNRFRFRSKVRDSRNIKVGRWAWDVFLNVAP